MYCSCFESYAENENECPACVNENRGILEKIRQQEKARTTDLAREFQAQIGVAGDGFDVVAEYFGKGVFNQVSELLQVWAYFTGTGTVSVGMKTFFTLSR